VYGLASRGFRFGGLQSVPSTPNNNVPAVYKSDKIWNYEIGFRTSWFGNTLHFDPALFYIDYQDPQIAQTTTGVPLGYTTNVSHAESFGGEIALRWLTPIPGLMTTLDGGITDAHTTVPFKASDGTIVPASAWMPGGARSQFSAAIDYALPYLLPLSIAAHVDYTYIGKTFTDIQNQHPVNDFGTASAGLVFAMPLWGVQPKLALSVSNLTNVTRPVYWETGKPLTSSVAGTYQTYIINPPRTFIARLAIDF
jgi:outer membrane receptor protein involved in Fe transport